MKQKFTNWVKWKYRIELEDINYPDIYCIAVSEQPLINFSFVTELEYIND